MIINSVRLKNFKSHADTKIDFVTGINVILGDNGAGKTSVLEAISYALFKDYGGNLEDLVRRGQESMSVEVVFTVHGRSYKLVRTRSQKGSNATLSVLLDGGEKLLREGDSGVNDEVEKILGIDKNLFTNAVYVKQGQIAELLIAKSFEKKKIIGRLLGIDALEKVWERMRPVVDKYKDRKNRLEARILDGDRIAAQIDELEAQSSDARQRIARTDEKIKSASEKLAAAEKEEKRLADAEKKYEKLSAVISSSGDELEREEERLADARMQLPEMEKAEVETAALKKKLAPGWKAEIDKKMSAARKRASEIDGGVGALSARIADLRELGEKLGKVKNKCPLCGSELTEAHRGQMLRERELKIGEAESEKKKLSVERAAVEKEMESLAEKKEEMSELEKRLSEFRGLAGRRDAILKSMKESEILVKKLKDKIKSAQAEMKPMESEKKAFEELRGKISALRTELTALERAKSLQLGKMLEMESSLKRLRAEAEDIRTKKKEHEKLAGFVSVLEEIRKLFDKSGLQRELRIKSGPVIEQHTREFFRNFNFEYSDLSLDENYDVILYGPAGETTTDMISGGERIAAALAMRLGIARTLVGGSAESMLLDEPTIFLDSQRRQDLIEVLKRLTVMPQLIVVTHDTALEEAADRIAVIKKEKGVSFVEDG